MMQSIGMAIAYLFAAGTLGICLAAFMYIVYAAVDTAVKHVRRRP